MNPVYKFTRCCGRLWGSQSQRYVSYIEIWINFSIRMVMKTSTDFCLLDEERYTEMFKAVSTR